MRSAAWNAPALRQRSREGNPKMQAQPTVSVKAASVRQPSCLQDLTPQQWKSGIAAWLGWFFDGLDMHLYTLIAAPFVAELLHAASPMEQAVKEKSSWIQAAFLLGWGPGGGIFCRIRERLRPLPPLSLAILPLTCFT